MFYFLRSFLILAFLSFFTISLSAQTDDTGSLRIAGDQTREFESIEKYEDRYILYFNEARFEIMTGKEFNAGSRITFEMDIYDINQVCTGTTTVSEVSFEDENIKKLAADFSGKCFRGEEIPVQGQIYLNVWEDDGKDYSLTLDNLQFVDLVSFDQSTLFSGEERVLATFQDYSIDFLISRNDQAGDEVKFELTYFDPLKGAPYIAGQCNGFAEINSVAWNLIDVPELLAIKLMFIDFTGCSGQLEVASGGFQIQDQKERILTVNDESFKDAGAFLQQLSGNGYDIDLYFDRYWLNFYVKRDHDINNPIYFVLNKFETTQESGIVGSCTGQAIVDHLVWGEDLNTDGIEEIELTFDPTESNCYYDLDLIAGSFIIRPRAGEACELNQGLLEENKYLKEGNQLLNETIDQLNIDLNEAGSEISTLNSALLTCTNELNAAESEIASLSSDLFQCNADLDVANIQIANLQTDLTESIGRENATLLKLQDTELLLSASQVDLSNTQQDLRDANDKISGLDKNITDLNDELLSCQKKIFDPFELSATVRSLSQEIGGLKYQNSRLKRRIKRLKRKLNNS